MTMQNDKSTKWRKKTVSQRALPAQILVSDDEREAYPPHPGRRTTEKEFDAWVHEKTRAEWVDGEVIIMSPVNFEHDQLQSWLLRLISQFVEDQNLGTVCSSEFYMRLPMPSSKRLPDVSFIATSNPGKFENAAFRGSPDLLIEVVSPDSTYRDYREKMTSYQASGVKEYWLIDPLSKRAELYELIKGKYRVLSEKSGMIHSKVLKGLYLKPAWLWQRPLPKMAVVLREMGHK